MLRIRAAGPIEPGPAAIDADELHHLTVRRADDGAPVEVLDGAGRIGTGRIEGAGRAARVVVTAVRTVPRPADLVLLVGAGDRDRFLWLVEKAAEVGATRLIPVETARSRNVATRVRPEHLDRLERRAAEAMKQCGGAWDLEVRAPVPLAAALATVDTEHRWLAAANAPPARVPAATARVSVAIGPEGGFTDDEVAALVAAGFEPTGLGPRIMRFETAALAAATVAGLARKETDG